MVSAVFVYGTLKQGQCRETLWPAEPLSIQIGWVDGVLWGRSDYPAMIAGDDRVLGELWSFDAERISLVLETLDQIEGVGLAAKSGLAARSGRSEQNDLYSRVLVEIRSVRDEALGKAWSYQYASDPAVDGFVQIHARGRSPVQWP